MHGIRARARASRAAAPRAVRARPPGRAGQRDADHGRRRPAGPRGHPGDPQSRLRRRAWPAAAEHRHRRFAWRPAGARRRAGRPHRDRALHRGGAARHRTAAGACGRGDAGAQPGRRPRARRGRGAHELRPVEPDRGALRSRRPGDPQLAERHQQLEEHRSRTARSRCRTTCPTPMPVSEAAGSQEGTAGGDHQLRDQQDGPHADPRAAADRAHQPRGDGRRHGQRRRRWQACLAATRGGGTGSHHRPGEERDRLRREARRPRRGGEHALRRRGRRAGRRRPADCSACSSTRPICCTWRRPRCSA